MGGTNDFTVIPALDLKDGVVVHAKGGSRAGYPPIASPFGAADGASRQEQSEHAQ